MNRDQIAINTVSLTANSLPDCLDAVATAGFAKVEFALGQVKPYLDNGHSVASVQALLQERELTCIGGFELDLNCFGAADERAANHDQVVANAQLLGELGATTMVVGSDGPESTMAVEEKFNRYAESFASVADRIAGYGVTVCLEFNWGPAVKSLRTAVEIARRSGRDNVGVLFDPAHFHCTQSKLSQLTPEAIGYIRHVHVDDMRDIPGEWSNCNSDRVLPGEGCLDLPGLIATIEAGGYRGDFSIEMFSDELWQLPAADAATAMYQSMLPLCG